MKELKCFWVLFSIIILLKEWKSPNYLKINSSVHKFLSIVSRIKLHYHQVKFQLEKVYEIQS